MHLLLYWSRFLHYRLKLVERQVLINTLIQFLKLSQQSHTLRIYPLITQMCLQILRQQHPRLNRELFNVSDHTLLYVHANPPYLHVEVFEVLLVGRFQQVLDDVFALVGLALVVVQLRLLDEWLVDLRRPTFWFAWRLLYDLLLLHLLDVPAIVAGVVIDRSPFAIFSIPTILRCRCWFLRHVVVILIFNALW